MPRFLGFLVLFCLSSAQAEVRLLTSIKPLQLIAAAVQEGVGQPDVLLPGSALPHHYALRPSDIRRIREADLLYWIGPDMEAFLPRVLAGRNKPHTAVQQLPGMQLRYFEASADHAQADKHQDHAHRPGSLDAHLWLLPANAIVIAERMADDLSRLDTDNAQRYQTNLEGFRSRLNALHQQLTTQLAGVAGKPYFVFHETLNYFETAYGLEHAGVFDVLGEARPGARHVAGIRQRLRETAPSCLFIDTPERPRLAETLTAELPVALVELDPLGNSVTVDANGYERLLSTLARTMTTCLSQL